MQTHTASRRRPHLIEDIMPFPEYRGNLAACFDHVNETHRPLIVTRKGRADAVLVSAADFNPKKAGTTARIQSASTSLPEGTSLFASIDVRSSSACFANFKSTAIIDAVSPERRITISRSTPVPAPGNKSK